MSEESDIEDPVAFEQDDDLDEYDSDEYGSQDAYGFLDMEAAEFDGQSDDGSVSDDTEQQLFPQFMRLPPELRSRIWEFFNSDLKVKARVFNMVLTVSPLVPWDSAGLEQQTAPARAMLATHQESRQLALKSYPDTLTFAGGYSILRYHSKRDVILFTGGKLRLTYIDEFISWLGDTRYVAIEFRADDLQFYNDILSHPARKLKAIYCCFDSLDHYGRSQRWCGSNLVHKYHTQMTERVGHRRSVVESIYCWPDLDNHQEFAEEVIIKPAIEHLQNERDVWPMISFETDSAIRRFHDMQAAAASGREYSDSEDESDSESGTEDQYESEGIDDATIASDDLSEDENDLVVQSDSDDGNMSPFNGFSPLQEEDYELHLGDEIGGGGNFSSLEPESPNRGGDDSEHAISDEEPVQNTIRRKRRIVSSDDEHDSEGDESAKMPSRPAKRSRVVLSDTEDEEDEGGNAAVEGGHGAADESEDEENPEEVEQFDESENEEPVKAMSMSLFEKLRQFREDNPIPSETEAGSDAESMGSEGFDGGDGIGFLDDEAEVEDEDELLGGDGMPDEYSEAEDDEF
ncbi:hypothetical protein F4677DRAFT_433258 [Hypoxylon crocopeplum]|nr:hypothetical protein F4677DRAFT_433258 [Hypoxylon crocopeplum]